ncbi:hypothetical protein RJT34_10949 [Clitoria ternatea]|uniref:FBD domain-containing protein n=1 Tax=Clitoria ternatea TaxID=43366 RepID=A0AAN9JJ15_CLITE
MNVRHLIMKTALHEHEFLGIALLLNSCPKLKCLTIELSSEKVLLDYEPVLNFNRTRFWIENVQIYKCLISSLKVVEIKGFKGSENEILVLKYFITCGKKLKMMSINILKGDGVGSSNGGNAESYHREKAESLLKIRRASTRLEILIS